jgi:uncharacterized protein
MKRLLQALCFSLSLLASASAWAHFQKGVDAYERGEFAKALLEFKEDGSPEALFYLGRMYERGEGVKQDGAEAARLLKEAEGAGFSARVNEDGDGIRAAFYRSGAEVGNPKALTTLGEMYFWGDGMRQDTRKARHYFSLAAQLGSPPAQFRLYQLLSQRPAEMNEALHWLWTSADHGYATAQYVLGLKYYVGDGVPPNREEAARLYRMAAGQGHNVARYTLARMYFSGDGVVRDACKTARLLLPLARSGNPNAQNNVAYLYDNGDCVGQDKEIAAVWYLKAALAGYPAAQHNIAVMYLKGEGVAQNPQRALHWFEQAAARGHEGAREALEKLREK